MDSRSSRSTARPRLARVLGDLTGEGDINGLDVGPFLNACLAAPLFDSCADLAAPSGGALDQEDLNAFVALMPAH